MLLAQSTLALDPEPARPAAPGEQPAPAPITTTPTPAQALGVLARTRLMLTSWGQPSASTSPALQPVPGVAVVLRFQGQIVGRASSLAGAGQTIDPLGVIGQAMNEAENRLPVRGDKLDEDQAQARRFAKLRLLAPEVTISVELAGPLTILEAPTYAQVEAEAPWMLSGLAAQLSGQAGGQAGGPGGEQPVAGVFPSFMQMANLGPAEGLGQAVSRATGQAILALLEPGELRSKHQVRLYRFAVVHAVEPSPDAPAEVLYRGQRLIDQTQIDDVPALRAFADTLADQLSRNTAPGTPPVGMQPIGPSAQIEPATPRQAAAIALALSSYVAVRAGNRQAPPPAEVLARAERAAGIVAGWAVASPEIKADPAACAMLALALGTDAPEEIKLVVAGAFMQATEAMPAGFAEAVPVNARGLLALAQPTPQLRADATRAAFAGQTPATVIAMMPWLAWAELGTPGTIAGTVPAASALRQMRTQVWQNQLAAVDAREDRRDLVGGILIPGSRHPLPSWQSARAVAALATMMADDRLTGKDERGAEIVRLLASARFLRQLQVDRTLAWLAEDPQATLGGVRPSVFDQRVSAEATSMTLLAVVELLKAIDTLSNK